VDEILVEEARSFSNSGNNHELAGILSNYFGVADILEDIRTGKKDPNKSFYPVEKWKEMMENNKKRLEDFILAEKRKRATI
jgi:hypothetical protein